ncbi:hypothetical protein VP01_800g5 [Puccinia sorghi]|uniref:Uncharacterized protein n=1 Tax=Puccinia sorghi TaxID=27349 RepID=A0A0L6UAL0_9BASI|nr:hypothetical protein VP01_800g5 [Puccinia sorghi]
MGVQLTGMNPVSLLPNTKITTKASQKATLIPKKAIPKSPAIRQKFMKSRDDYLIIIEWIKIKQNYKNLFETGRPPTMLSIFEINIYKKVHTKSISMPKSMMILKVCFRIIMPYNILWELENLYTFGSRFIPKLKKKTHKIVHF